MTTTPPPHRWGPLLLPAAEAIEWLITQLDAVTEKKHFTTCSALDWFKATLIRANIAIDGVAKEQINVWLLAALLAWHFYRRQRLRGKSASPLGGPSKELLELNVALGKWLNSTDCWFERVFLHSKYKRVQKPSNLLLDQTHIADELFNASAELIDKMEAIKKKTRGESAETALQLELHKLYVNITGKDGLSDDGPAHRFVKTFAAEIDESIKVSKKGWADAIRKGRNRRKRELEQDNLRK